MDVDACVQSILEEMLDSGCTPEEACRDRPELLPLVLKEWRRKLECDAHFDALFAASRPDEPPPFADELPQIPGHEIQEILGRGGMGVVYKARHVGLNRAVAVKLLLGGPHSSREARERFLREAESAAGLRHPNIVQVHELGNQGGQPYFTMEFVEGGNLARKLGGTPQSPREAAALLATLAEAVDAAHRSGIVHRDLKPSNILLTADGTPKVGDFGLARRLDDGPGLTLTGTAVGTPSYMAPEQAEPRTRAWGPAVDIYALGVILYESLAGRPPFQGETAAETVRQVVSRDPVPPSRLNARVPRDLETICLKCLLKEPNLRYAGAADLAADLRRFLAGEAISARSSGRLTRLVRRARRRPILSSAVTADTLLAAGLLGAGLWLISDRAAAARAAEVERAAAERAADSHLREMVESLREGAWPEARVALERAKAWLVQGGSEDLRGRAATGDRDLELAGRLDAIRMTGYAGYGQGHDFARSDGEYHKVFRQAGLGEPDADPQFVAARVGASDIRAALLAALDDWTIRARDPRRQRWASDVARLADGGSAGWRGRAFDPAIWKDEAALFRLIETAPSLERSAASLLAIELQADATAALRVAFLRRLHARHPRDFWVDSRLGAVLLHTGEPEEAVGYYRAALALRPGVAMVHSNLGVALALVDRPDEAAEHFRRAVALDPAGVISRENLVISLWSLGWRADAILALPEALRLNPGSAPLHTLAGKILEADGRDGEAFALYRQAVAIDPKSAHGQKALRTSLMRRGRRDDARVAWNDALEEGPPEHEAWYGYAELCLFLGREEDYQDARRALLARFGATNNSVIAERTARACLLRPASGEELRRAVSLAEAVGSIDRAIALGYYPFFQFVRGLAEYRLGRLDRAIALMRGEAAGVLGPAPRLVVAMALHQDGRAAEARRTLAEAVLAFDWTADEARDQDGWICHALRREAEAMILPDLPAFLEGRSEPRDNDERLALLGICQSEGRTGAMARLYAEAFAAAPGLAEDVGSGHRYRAARAAALAGLGRGKDAGRLGPEDRARWRRQALAWLELDLAARVGKLGTGGAAGRRAAGQMATRWLSDPDLAGLRGPAALEALSVGERDGWLALWKKLEALLDRAPGA